MVWELKLDLELLTPLYMGGAGQEAELRAPSLKGLLRFWYRAADPFFGAPWQKGGVPWEARIFGGEGGRGGQSAFSLRIESGAPPVSRWPELRTNRFSQGSGKNARNGLVYLGYPFQMSGNESRTFIAPGHRFRVRCLLPRPPREEAQARRMRRALAAAWWLLGHMGGAGSRARRGFGGLALRAWKGVPGDAWPELDELALLGDYAGADVWRSGFERGRAALRGWFGDHDEALHHPHLGSRFRYVLDDRGFAKGQWDAAMAHMGGRLQEFRRRRPPDYQIVKDHLLAASRQGGKVLQAAPPRVSFGLPLTFRYSGVRETVTLAPFEGSGRGTTFERHGSLLFLRLVPVGAQLHPLYSRLDGDVPGASPPAALRKESTALLPFTENAMDSFMDSLVSPRR